MVQVAAFGLAKAIDRYDPARGVPLRGYAIPTITGEIRRYRRDHCWAVRPPRTLQELILKVTRCVDRLSTQTGHSPSPEEVAADLGETPEAVVEALVAGRSYLAESLDAPAFKGDEDGAATLGDAMATVDEGYGRCEHAALLESLRDELADDEWLLLHLRFAADWTQEEIGEQLGVSQMTVSRRQRAALQRLRRRMGGDAPPARRARAVRTSLSTDGRPAGALPDDDHRAPAPERGAQHARGAVVTPRAAAQRPAADLDAARTEGPAQRPQGRPQDHRPGAPRLEAQRPAPAAFGRGQSPVGVEAPRRPAAREGEHLEAVAAVAQAHERARRAGHVGQRVDLRRQQRQSARPGRTAGARRPARARSRSARRAACARRPGAARRSGVEGRRPPEVDPAARRQVHAPASLARAASPGRPAARGRSRTGPRARAARAVAGVGERVVAHDRHPGTPVLAVGRDEVRVELRAQLGVAAPDRAASAPPTPAGDPTPARRCPRPSCA